MGNWKCDCCTYWKPHSQRRTKVNSTALWNSYSQFNPKGLPTDIICRTCYMKIRKNVDGLTKHGVHTRLALPDLPDMTALPETINSDMDTNEPLSQISTLPLSQYLTQQESSFSTVSSVPIDNYLDGN